MVLNEEGSRKKDQQEKITVLTTEVEKVKANKGVQRKNTIH